VRVLVTGHAGYVGPVVVDALARAGHDVVGLDTFLFEPCTLGPGPPAVEALAVDIRDVDAAQLRGFDAVVHLAALSNDPLGNLAPEFTREINHAATVSLARHAREAGVRRFLFASSCSIYGASGPEDEVAEDAPLRPLTAYAESKVRAEEDLLALADDDFSPVLLRSATAYGFAPRLRTDIVLNNLVASALLTGEVLVLSDGTPCRPLIHVEDMAKAFLAALEADRAAVHAKAFNVGSAAENYTVREIAETVAAAVPDSRLAITGQTGPDPRSYRVDFSRISRQLPAFAPTWSIVDGAQELLDAYRRHGLTAELSSGRFTRLAWIAAQQDAGSLGADLRPVGALPVGG
jgi:nucleoside-diphosphate-sugar epimerase